MYVWLLVCYYYAFCSALNGSALSATGNRTISNIMSPGVLIKNITVFPVPVTRGENFYTGTYNNNNQHIYFRQYVFAGRNSLSRTNGDQTSRECNF